MKKYILIIAVLLTLALTISCSKDQVARGSLKITSNGEAFIENGFVTKDGWALTFDHVYVGISDIKTYQLETPYDAHSQLAISESALHHLEDMIVTDFTRVSDLTIFDPAPLGHYNAMSWKIGPSNESPALQLIGEASKNDLTIPFDISLHADMIYYAGEYIGDSRKGFVKEDQQGSLEITLHIDHLFGDAESSMDDSINMGALGFEPFYAIGSDDKVVVIQKDINASLTTEENTLLKEILLGLFHVGEGHTYSENL